MAASVHPAQDPVKPTAASTAVVGQVRLRRAVYVHVSDLTSAYDIDHRKLEEELSRVRAEREQDAEERAAAAAAAAAATSPEIDASSYPQKRLQPPRGGYNLCVLVGSVNVVVDKKRVDGSRVRLAEVEVGDETGTVSLRARDDQIDVLQEVSAREGAVVLRNCMLELYQGKHIRLAVTKWGKLNTYPDNVASTPPPPSKRNQERNFSLIDLSLVASETAVQAFSSSTQAAAGGSTQPDAGGRSNVPPSKTISQGSQASRGGTQQQQSSYYPQQHMPKRGSGRGGGAGAGGNLNRPQRRHTQQPQPTLHAPPPHYSTDANRGGYSAMGWSHPPHEAPPIEVQQYPYSAAPPTGMATATDSATMSTAAAHQQMLLRQQYELQQRQIQHMFHEQRQQMAVAAAGSPPTDPQQQQQLHHHVSRSGSFGADPQQQAQQTMLVGTSPLLMPMSGLGSVPPLSTMHQHHGHQGSPDRQQQQQHHHMTASEAAMSPNKMNPQAATFAPSYVPYQGISQTSQSLSAHGGSASSNMPMTYAAAAYDHSTDSAPRGYGGVASAPASAGGFHTMMATMSGGSPQPQQQQPRPGSYVRQHHHHHQQPQGGSGGRRSSGSKSHQQR